MQVPMLKQQLEMEMANNALRSWINQANQVESENALDQLELGLKQEKLKACLAAWVVVEI